MYTLTIGSITDRLPSRLETITMLFLRTGPYVGSLHRPWTGNRRDGAN